MTKKDIEKRMKEIETSRSRIASFNYYDGEAESKLYEEWYHLKKELEKKS